MIRSKDTPAKKTKKTKKSPQQQQTSTPLPNNDEQALTIFNLSGIELAKKNQQIANLTSQVSTLKFFQTVDVQSLFDENAELRRKIEELQDCIFQMGLARDIPPTPRSSVTLSTNDKPKKTPKDNDRKRANSVDSYFAASYIPSGALVTGYKPKAEKAMTPSNVTEPVPVRASVATPASSQPILRMSISRTNSTTLTTQPNSEFSRKVAHFESLSMPRLT